MTLLSEQITRIRDILQDTDTSATTISKIVVAHQESFQQLAWSIIGKESNFVEKNGVCSPLGSVMQIRCAWCNVVMDGPGDDSQEPVSHGICPRCAAQVLFERAMGQLEGHMLEMIRMQGLLLEMLGDLYEVAQALAPKAGIAMQPAPGVRAWQQQRDA